MPLSQSHPSLDAANGWQARKLGGSSVINPVTGHTTILPVLQHDNDSCLNGRGSSLLLPSAMIPRARLVGRLSEDDSASKQSKFHVADGSVLDGRHAAEKVEKGGLGAFWEALG